MVNSDSKKKVPKKRGRKPKKALKKSTPKKRGRKPTSKLIDIRKKDFKKVQNNEDCLIAHIPLQFEDIMKHNNKSKSDTESSITEISFDNNYNENVFDNKYINYLENKIKTLEKKLIDLEKKKKKIIETNYNIVKL